MIDIAPMVEQQVAWALEHFDAQVAAETDPAVRACLRAHRPRIAEMIRSTSAVELAKAVEAISPAPAVTH